MRIILAILIALHALIHVLGFVDAFGIQEIAEFRLTIPEAWGVVWLAAGLGTLATAAMVALRARFWWLVGFASALLSQVLVIRFWADASFGAVPNVLLLLISFVGYRIWWMEHGYRSDVRQGLARTGAMAEEVLTEENLAHLPELVQGYLRYAGVVGKPMVRNFRATFDAQMRGREQDWFDLRAEQHNFYDRPERLFFLWATVRGIPTQGYHRYKDVEASMVIRILSLIPVVNQRGPEMFQADTVTLFNDMCFLAPATLIDERIRWEPVDGQSVRGVFGYRGVEVSAELHFDEQERLVNFVSDDRYDINEMRKYRFSTPLSDFQEVNGRRMPTYGEAVWHYPEGEFVYGKYRLREVAYNVK